MENGYYLSAYISINELGSLYDYFFRHDQAMALWKLENENVSLIRYWELERKTGLKGHSRSFYCREEAMEVIEECLKECSLTINDIKAVWGTPEIDDEFLKFWDINPAIADHAVNHLYSALMSDTDAFKKETVISLAYDGGPDRVIDKNAFNKKYYAGSISVNGEIKKIFPINSPGLLWNHIKNVTGKREGTLMALATASTSESFIEAPLLLVCNHKTMEKAYAVLDEIYEEIKAYDASDAGVKFNHFDERFTETENKMSMFAKIVSEISIKVVDHEIQGILVQYDLNSEECCICISGGYGLNCPTNTYLLNKYHFKKFISVPCVSDTGMALGIGLRAFYLQLGNKMNFKLGTPFYGSECEDGFWKEKYKQYIASTEVADDSVWIEDITKQPVVWIDGKAEIGPRALGHRSLIAAPSVENKDKLNRIKLREWWRPVAPLVLKEDANDWFEMCCDETPFMLHTCKVRPDKLEKIHAIVHMDNSARVQTLTKEVDSRLYHLIKAYRNQTGIPVICNTSLNDKGEPIIDNIDEAFNFALRKKIGVMYINGERVELKNHELYEEVGPAKRPFDGLMRRMDEKKEIRQNVTNPYRLSRREIGYLCLFENFLKKYDLRKESDAEQFHKFVTKVDESNPIDIDEIFLT